jgi:hypothetical protein
LGASTSKGLITIAKIQKDVTFIRIIILQLTFKNAGKKQYKFGCEKNMLAKIKLLVLI